MNADYDQAVRDHMVDLLHFDSELAALIGMRPEANHLLIVNVAVWTPIRVMAMAVPYWATLKNSPNRSD